MSVTKLSIMAGLLVTAMALTANASIVVNPVGVTGHDGGNWPSTLGHLTDMLNGNNVGFLTGDHNPGMTVNDPADPSTWTYAGNSWPQEWKANSRLSGATNGKIGYAIIDLGSAVTSLENLYLWNVRSQNNTENVASFNLYVATSPTAAPPSMPNSKTTRPDYDFASGGWTQVGGTNALAQNNANNNTPQGIFSLGGATAQYIGIEILTAGGTANRVGLAQAEITRTPEPASLALLGLGGLLIARRRG